MMKKAALALTLLLCMILSPLSVSARTAIEDSFVIDDDTRNLLAVSEDDIVMRIYKGYFLYGLHTFESLDKTFNDGWSYRDDHYVIASTDENGETTLVSKEIKDGIVSEVTGDYHHSAEDDFFLYKLSGQTDRILSVLGGFVHVNKTICMHGQPEDGMYIYYETNCGSFMYYRNSKYDEAEYLFPLKEFYCFAKSLQEKRSQTSEPTPYDATAYDLRSYTAPPYGTIATVMWCAVPVLLLTIGGVWFALRKRKKAQTQEPTME